MSNNELNAAFKSYNTKEADELLELYKVIIDSKKNLINNKTYISIIEKHFNGKVSCGTCPSSIKKAHSDFEKVIFTKLYRSFPNLLCKPDKSKLIGTRFVNGMYETLITSSFQIFGDLLSSFCKDYTGKRITLSKEKYDDAYNELVKFNTSRYRYFDEEDGIYASYLRFKELSILIDTNTNESKDNAAEADLNALQSIPAPIKVDVQKLVIKEGHLATKGQYETQRKVDLEEALKLKKEGKNNVEIAEHFKVSKQAIGKLFKKHLEEDTSSN